MKRPVVFMFSGQGSQYAQMGKELYDGHPTFRKVFDRGDAFVRERIGRSIGAELYSANPRDDFDELVLSHPALVIMGYAVHQTLVAEGVVPDRVWGSSLGELVAAVAAGVWSLETALDAVLEQARLVTSRCAPGGMLAILEEPALYEQLVTEGHPITLAGVNFPRHFTISGGPATLDSIEAMLKRQGITHQRLPVRYAFHSPMVDSVAADFIAYCRTLPAPRPPNIEYLSGVTGEPLTDVSFDYFWSVVRGPMRFADVTARLEREGPAVYVDCGPSGTAATFVKYNLAPGSGSVCHPILTAFRRGLQNVEKVKSELAVTAS